MSDFPARLDYAAGLENAPGDPFGRTELSVAADGRARLVHRHVDRVRAWVGKVDLPTLAAVWAALERGGFPAVAQHAFRAGSAVRTVTAHRGDVQQRTIVAWHEAPKLHGYREAFPMLDSIVRQMTGDTVHATPNTLPPVVSELAQEPQ